MPAAPHGSVDGTPLALTKDTPPLQRPGRPPPLDQAAFF